MKIYKCNYCNNNKYKKKNKLTERIGADPLLYNVVKCTNCNLHSLHPIPKFSELASIYKNYAIKGDRIFVEKYRIKNVYPHKIASIIAVDFHIHQPAHLLPRSSQPHGPDNSSGTAGRPI